MKVVLIKLNSLLVYRETMVQTNLVKMSCVHSKKEAVCKFKYTF